MTWELAIIAAAVLGVAGFSRHLSNTPVTPQMVFVGIGVLAGPLVIDQVAPAPTGSDVRVLAEATLAVVLFADASRIRLRALIHDRSLPLRLLGIGLPLTIVLGAIVAAGLFPHLTLPEAVVLAVVLAPTDAALGQAVVTEPRLPLRISQGLNVESGLNDGICVPLLLIVLAAAEVQDSSMHVSHAVTVVLEELGYGALGGVVAGLAAAGVVVRCRRQISGSWLQVIPVAGAALAYGIAAALGGSGFIAAFVAGGVFGELARQDSDRASRLSEEVGGLLGGVTFLVFGAVLLGPALKHITPQVGVYSLLSLTLIRMLPVALCLSGTGAKLPTLAFLGWFGPRGLASIVFAVIVVEDAHLPGVSTILLTTYLTIGVSVFAHGLTAAPLARRYAAWYSNRRGGPAGMESLPVAQHRSRGPASHA